MEKISFEQFKNKIKQGEKDFTNLILENMNLENYDLIFRILILLMLIYQM